MITDDTIIAQASAQGNAQRGIVRLSGERVLEAVAPFFFRRTVEEQIPPHNLVERAVTASDVLENDAKPSVIPGWFAPWGDERPTRLVRCSLFYWPQGRGFTGERAVELHVPGAPPILDAIVRAVCEKKPARLANPGEFTLRAFLSGRIDLTQAEAVLGAIDAESDVELQNALTQLSGNLSQEFATLREQLFDVLCDLEAGFDFVDEDIEFVSKEEIRNRLIESRDHIEETLKRAKTRIGSDRTPKVVLAGSPNVGKSSLFNIMTELFAGDKGQAIVSNLAGTTRDYLEKELQIAGVKFVLVDSAGVEDVASNVENEAPTPRVLAQDGLAKLFADAAAIVRCLEKDATDPTQEKKIDSLIPSQTPIVRVITKQDETDSVNNDEIATSSLKRKGFEELGAAIVETLQGGMENGEIVPSTAIRCQEALREAKEALDNSLNMLDDLQLRDDFLLASEIRLALDRIGLVTGQVHTDDLLDRIFSKFCIGK